MGMTVDSRYSLTGIRVSFVASLDKFLGLSDSKFALDCFKVLYFSAFIVATCAIQIYYSLLQICTLKFTLVSIDLCL